MRDDPIVVLAQPRSGSTLVQRLLNLCPGVTIMGEHGGPFHKIAYAYLKFEKFHKQESYKMRLSDDELREMIKRKNDFTVATCGGVRIETVRELTRQFIRAIGNPLNNEFERWGFKEVVTPDVGDTVIELFPASQVICLVRDPVDCINSIVRTSWWGRDLNWITNDAWKQKFDSFRELACNYPGSVMLARYEQYSSRLPEIFEWLNLEWTPEHQTMLDGEHVGAADSINRDAPLTPEETAFVRETCKDYYVT